MKINTDAGIACNTVMSGTRGIAKSSTGFIGACKPFQGVTDPMIAEALSLREGVIFAQLRGFSRVVMEVDCLEIVNLYNSRAGSSSVVTPVLG